VPSQLFTKRDAGQASETRQMAEAEQSEDHQSGGSGFLGILLVMLGIATVVVLFFATR
jgi:hypothetical protein